MVIQHGEVDNTPQCPPVTPKQLGMNDSKSTICPWRFTNQLPRLSLVHCDRVPKCNSRSKRLPTSTDGKVREQRRVRKKAAARFRWIKLGDLISFSQGILSPGLQPSPSKHGPDANVASSAFMGI